MFVIFGTRGVKSTQERGSFYCPQCRDTCSYEKKSVRRFFTLFFIPVIPLDQIGEYVECAGCAGTFKETVLSYDPQAEQRRFEAEFQKAMKQLMIHMLLADGRVDDSELDAVSDIYERLSGQPISPGEVGAEAMQLSAAEADPLAIAAEFGPTLNNAGKEMVLKAGLMVAGADGEVSDEELALLAGIAESMDVSRAHFRGIVSSPVTS